MGGCCGEAGMNDLEDQRAGGRGERKDEKVEYKAPPAVSVAKLMAEMRRSDTARLRILFNNYVYRPSESAGSRPLGEDLKSDDFWRTITECGATAELVARSLMGGPRGYAFCAALDRRPRTGGHEHVTREDEGEYRYRVLTADTAADVFGSIADGTIARFQADATDAQGHTFTIVRAGGNYHLLQGYTGQFAISPLVRRPESKDPAPTKGIRTFNARDFQTWLADICAVDNTIRTATLGPCVARGYNLVIAPIRPVRR